MSESGTEKIECIALDEDIDEHITFIKMDIEGSEKKAIEGAKGHIARDKPKLAVCVYHLIDDLWKIPLRINDIAPGYQFYLRQHLKFRYTETVLYCVPAQPPVVEPIPCSEEMTKRLVTICTMAAKHKRENTCNYIGELEDGKMWLEAQYYLLTKAIENFKRKASIKETIKKLFRG